MFSKPLALSAAMAIALACSPFAFAATPQTATAGSNTTMQTHAGQHHWRGKHWRRHGEMGALRKLDLTDAQHASIKQAMHASFQQARPEMKTLREQRMAFNNATPGTAAYQTAASNYAEAESVAARARIQRQAAVRTKIYNILTPAQRTQLASIRSERQAKMKQWRDSHMRHHVAPRTSDNTGASS